MCKINKECLIQTGGLPPVIFYKIIQIKPLQPSLITLSIVSLNLFRASSGILYSLLSSPSLTKELSGLPKILVFQISA